MKGLRSWIVGGSILALGVGIGFLGIKLQYSTYAYPASCVTQACREAYDRSISSKETADQLSERANTLEGEIEQLNEEIANLENDIALKQAITNDLALQIQENQNKLDLQHAALAELLVNIHFEEKTTDSISLLASSSTISDLTEKQARQDNLKEQVALSAESIKAAKDDLETQKVNMDELIAEAQNSRDEITSKRNRQTYLRNKYEKDSAAYEKDAAEARETMQKEIAAEIARNNRGGVVGDGVNSYPWAKNCPADDSDYYSKLKNGNVIGGYVCQCTSYAGWKAYEYWGVVISFWGNAKSWGSSAIANGYRVDNKPEAHTIGYSTAGVYGHVVWIESVNSNGTVNLTEYNNSSSAKSGKPGDFGARYNVPASAYRYIHFE